MGFLDNVKDALKDAVTTQASKDAEAAEPKQAPADTSTDTAPTETTPVDPAPTDSAPTDTTPAETTPADTAPAETTPVDPAPADSAPTDTGTPPPPTSSRADDRAERQEARAENKAEREREQRQSERQSERQEAREERQEERQESREADKAKQGGGAFETYTVKSGDTLSEIGARFGVPYMEIARVNKIDNPDLIFPGQVFRIPKS